jgi:hypothetical protein
MPASSGSSLGTRTCARCAVAHQVDPAGEHDVEPLGARLGAESSDPPRSISPGPKVAPARCPRELGAAVAARAADPGHAEAGSRSRRARARRAGRCRDEAGAGPRASGGGRTRRDRAARWPSVSVIALVVGHLRFGRLGLRPCVVLRQRGPIASARSQRAPTAPRPSSPLHRIPLLDRRLRFAANPDNVVSSWGEGRLIVKWQLTKRASGDDARAAARRSRTSRARRGSRSRPSAG